MLQNYFFLDFGLFWPILTKKQSKKQTFQNPNRLMKFSETWYVDAFQQKNATKNFFWVSAFFGRFLTKKQPKNSQFFFWQNPKRLIKFSEIWYVDAS